MADPLDSMGLALGVVTSGMESVDAIYKIGERLSQVHPSEGNSYLDKDFPQLTQILTAQILGRRELRKCEFSS